MERAYTFSDVLLVPKYSDITSRKDVDLSTSLGPFNFTLPVVSANMKTITGPEMAVEMINNGGLGILHRFNSIVDNVNMFEQCRCKTIGVSIGVQEDDKDRFFQLYSAGAKVFCIDVAHGHHINVKKMLQWIKSQNIKDIYIIAGNIATGNAVYDLADWGANCCKVGLGSGFSCQTRKNTGVGIPQLYALEMIKEQLNNQRLQVKLIADGGIRSVGDIAKALKYADMVMLGYILSGLEETPGEIFDGVNGSPYKVYMGSASSQNKLSSGQSTDYVEGIAIEVPYRGNVSRVLKRIKEGVQSAFSYVGAKNLKEFQKKAEFIYITDGARQESKI